MALPTLVIVITVGQNAHALALRVADERFRGAHLGILSREYHVPCLMAAQIDGLKEGDEILVEYSKRAADAYADAQSAAEQRARILKVS